MTLPLPSAKALLAGGIVHYLLGYILLAIPIIHVLMPLQSDEVGFEKLSEVFLAAIEGTARLSYLQMLAGFTSALIAGYAAARIARRNELLNGCLAALPCSALTAYRMATNENVLTSTADILMIAAAFVFALLGGFVARLRKRPTAISQKP